MRYHIEVRSYWTRSSRLECKVITCATLHDAIEEASDMALDTLQKGADEVIDIWVVEDDQWQQNKWSDGYHFSFDNLKMGFRMYRNEVQE